MEQALTVIHDSTNLASLGSHKLLLLAPNEDGQLIACASGRETDSQPWWLQLSSEATEGCSCFSLWSWECFSQETGPPDKGQFSTKSFQDSSFRLNNGFGLGIHPCLIPGSEPVCLADEKHGNEFQFTDVLFWEMPALCLQCDYLYWKPLRSNGYEARKMK